MRSLLLNEVSENHNVWRRLLQVCPAINQLTLRIEHKLDFNIKTNKNITTKTIHSVTQPEDSSTASYAEIPSKKCMSNFF